MKARIEPYGISKTVHVSLNKKNILGLGGVVVRMKCFSGSEFPLTRNLGSTAVCILCIRQL